MGRDDKRLAYQGKVEAQLKEWGSQIDRWQDRVKVNTQELITQLNHKRQVVRSRLAEMKTVDNDQWQLFKANLDEAVEDMRRTVNEAREHFRQA
jgi:hypothetical protein